MVAVAEPQARQSFFLTRVDVEGNSYTVPNADGFVYMYEPGSTVPRTTWLDSAQTAANTNPILLDPDGRCSIWGTGQYRQLVTDAHGNEQWDGLVELGIDGTFVPDLILDAPIQIDGPNPNPPLNNPVQGTRALNAVLGSFVDARNFGPLRQGGDDFPIIQQALSYAAGIGGATVYLGPGPLNTVPSSQLSWPSSANGVVLKGDGPFTTVISVRGNMTQDVVELTAGNLMHAQVRDLGFAFTGTPGGGAVIHAANARYLVVDNVWMTGPFWLGTLIEGGANQARTTIRDVTCETTPSSTYCLQIGGDTTGVVQQTHILNCTFKGAGRGIVIRNASGVEVSDTQLLDLSSGGLVTNPPASVTVGTVQLQGVFVFNCGPVGFDIGDVGGDTSLVSLDSCWIIGNGVGVVISSRNHQITITNCQINGNQSQGIRQNGANGVLISGNMLIGNSVEGDGAADAIRIASGSNNVVNNNVIMSGSNRHAFGISINPGTTNSTVVGNSTSGGAGGSIYDGSGTGAGNVVANNAGT